MSDEVRPFVVGPIQTNCYAYVSDGECMVVDPGAVGAQIAKHLEDVTVSLVVATHRHHDHVCGVRALVKACGAPWAISEKDAEGAVRAVELSSHLFGVGNDDEQNPPPPDRLLHEGDVIQVGTARFTVIDAPGHTEGGIVLLGSGSAEGICFVGDTLFAGSCGRTDLVGGDHKVMMETLSRLSEIIPPETALLCGHGPSTVMEEELRSNPWLQSGPRTSDGIH